MLSRFFAKVRRAFPLLVGGAAVLAIIGGLQASPPRDVPTYALDSAVLYKCEVALALFFGAYLLIAAVVLAIEGRTVGKISTTGIELPSDLSASALEQQKAIESYERLRQEVNERDQRLMREVERLWDEVDRIRLPGRTRGER